MRAAAEATSSEDEGATDHGTHVASRSQERQGRGFSPGASRGAQPGRDLDPARGKPILDSRSPRPSHSAFVLF